MAKSWLYSTCMALALACVSTFATAYDYIKPLTYIVASDFREWTGVAAKFKAELSANCQCRTAETGRVNGMVKESNGYRIASMFKADSLPTEVGWRQSKV